MGKVNTIFDLMNNRIPEDTDKHIGVEIEFFCSYDEDDIARKILASRIKDYVTLKDDSSIEPGEDLECTCCGVCMGYADLCSDCETCKSCVDEQELYGHELCVLAKQKDFTRVIKLVGKFLRSIEAKTNSTCGLHVHLDARSRDVAHVFNNLVLSQDALFELCRESRRTNSFCRPTNTANWENVNKFSRHVAINPCAYDRHSTIEVRIKEGTVRVTDIECWVKLLIRTIEAPRFRSKLLDHAALKRKLKLPKYLNQYVQRKVARRA